MRLATRVVLVLAMTLAASVAHAQYMYLDSNGDGVNTSADVMPANGTPVTVDVYLNTLNNRDGSPAICPTGDGSLSFNSYVVSMRASGGTVSFTNYVNQVAPATTVLVPFTTSSTEMAVGRGCPVFAPPGINKLMTVTIQGVSGTPSVAIVRSTSLPGVLDVTSFGSFCSGNDFDNTLKLGSDWSDTDGIRQGGPSNSAPSIAAPNNVFGQTTVAMTISGSASDPDAGDAVTLTQTNNAPFLSGPGSAGPAPSVTITLAGTPSSTGSHTIQWRAVDASGAEALATTNISVALIDSPPVISAPSTANGTPGAFLNINAFASDADNNALNLSQTNDAPFFPPSSQTGFLQNPNLTLTGMPSASQTGNYTIHWTAVENVGQFLSATATTAVSVGTHPPVIVVSATKTGTVGTTVSITAISNDPDNQPVTLCVAGAPPFMTGPSCVGPLFTATLTRSGAPGPGDVGTYTLNWTSTDGTGNASTATTLLTIVNSNRCPTANAGGPYTGVQGVAVAFNGGASSDPDGDALTYAWDFGDGTNGSGVAPSHTYPVGANYTVTLVVSDGACSNTASTTAVITHQLEANAFTSGGNGTISLGAGKPFFCAFVEPLGGAFDVNDVNMLSVKMLSPGTGTVGEISADQGKSSVGGDKNGNGAPEFSACFRKADLRNLFSNLPNGKNSVTVTIAGSLNGGAPFSAQLNVVVKSTGGALAASISPNPLNPSAKLTFTTTKPGGVSVQLFDLSGRLVRTLLDDREAAAGWHDVTVDGRSAKGDRLTSGVYFVKIKTQHDGEETKSLTILK